MTLILRSGLVVTALFAAMPAYPHHGWGGNVDEVRVQPPARHRIIDLVCALPVGLEGIFAAGQMHAATAHGQQGGAEAGEYAGRLQGVDAAIGERQVDRAAGLRIADARIGPALINMDVGETASRQQNREQGAGRAGADDA